MNERIRQLAEECGLLYKQPGPSVETRYTKKKEETLAAFAELIVFECIKLVVFKGDAITGKAIKEHFGVEE